MVKQLLIKISAFLLLLSLASGEAAAFFTETEMLTVIAEKKQTEKSEDNKAGSEEGKENEYIPRHHFHLAISARSNQFPVYDTFFNSASYRCLPDNPPEAL